MASPDDLHHSHKHEMRQLTDDDYWPIIANPRAGGGRAFRLARKAVLRLEKEGHATDLLLTKSRGHALELANAAVASGATRLLVCGGDGTISEVLPALAGRETPLGLLPFGTANDFARAMGIPRSLDGALRTLFTGAIRKVDLGSVGDQLFSTVAAFGFDAHVNRKLAGHTRSPGTLTYLGAVFRELPRYSPPT